MNPISYIGKPRPPHKSRLFLLSIKLDYHHRRWENVFVMKNIRKPQLLAPAGNLAKMKTAFAFGADAVYLGVPGFSLRTRINHFDLKKIKAAIAYAHKLNKKVYVTVNIFAHNQHLKKLPAHVKALKRLQPDGLFISDPGIMTAIRKVWPQANLILSTQANCTNWQAAAFWQKQGMSRVILGRELSLSEVKEIHAQVPNLELECFVHGALCMAYSGRCFLSKLMTGRDANLGDCIQPCRWKYSQAAGREMLVRADGRDEIFELVEEEHGSYILNSNDLCLIRRIPELMRAGLAAFKIEGRAKSVYYLATVVGAYRRAIDNPRDKKLLDYLYKELEDKLYHRGYTEGFMFKAGRQAQNLDNSHNCPAWEFCGQVIAPPTKNYFRPHPVKGRHLNFIQVHNSLKIGDTVEILTPGYEVRKIVIKNILNIRDGAEMSEAHGGSGDTTITLSSDEQYPLFSVLRRKISI